MASLRERTRFATVLAVGSVLVTSGIVAGAAGGNFILGAANSAGTSNSSLTTSSTGTALLVTQNGTGTAVRGSTGTGSGIAGFFTSGSGSGVSGVVANENSYGIYAANDSINEGTGAALRVNGKQNEGVIATSDDTNALRGVVTGCDGFLFCGGNGVDGKGYGFGAGAFGDGTDSIAGVWGSDGAIAGIYGTQSGTDLPAIYADSTAGSGLYAFGVGGASIVDCTSFFCAGAVITGDNGVLAATATAGGFALYGADQTGTDSAYGLWVSGDAIVTDDLTVLGTCTGCAVAASAVNGSAGTLQQGDAVALRGVETASDGSVVLVVGPAKKGDAIIGIVDRELTLSGKTVTTKAFERTVARPGKGEVTVKTPARELQAQGRKWIAGGTKVAAGGHLRIITSGIFAMEATVEAVAVGDTLAVGDTTGKLAKADRAAERGTVAGKFLGKLKDGRSVLLVDPS